MGFSMTQTTVAKRKFSPLTLVLILSGVFFAVFMLVSGIVFMASPSGKPGPSSAGGSIFGGGTVGVVELNGVIMDSKKILQKLENFADEDSVKAIVVRLNSPGGAVGPSQEIYEAVRAYKKPLVVSMGTVAASGAFYIAMGSKKIYANPGTLTGSIGVIMEFLNLKDLYQWAKIHRYSIKTGKYKDAGAEYRDMAPEERALLQEMLQDVLGQFKKAVQTGRKLSPAQVDAIADGRIMSGAQAKGYKLVDELGTLQDAVNEAARLAKIKGKPTVVYSERAKRRKLLDLLFDDPRDEVESSLGENRVMTSGLGRLISALTKEVTGVSQMETSDPGFMPGIYWLWNGSH